MIGVGSLTGRLVNVAFPLETGANFRKPEAGCRNRATGVAGPGPSSLSIDDRYEAGEATTRREAFKRGIPQIARRRFAIGIGSTAKKIGSPSSGCSGGFEARRTCSHRLKIRLRTETVSHFVSQSHVDSSDFVPERDTALVEVFRQRYTSPDTFVCSGEIQ
jgi:hypothetical protein